jgi:cation diffusion facilitator CzcD-associated flavoprotein CzcO
MEREYGSYLDYIKDPELKNKLTPDYNLGCTRIPKSDKNYYEAVQLPNAHVVKGEIARIEPDGVVMADGTRVKLDVLVYATGFDAHAYMRPMNVTGLNGTTIDEACVLPHRGMFPRRQALPHQACSRCLIDPPAEPQLLF